MDTYEFFNQLNESPFVNDDAMSFPDDAYPHAMDNLFSRIDQLKALPAGDGVGVNKLGHGDKLYYFAEGRVPKNPTVASIVSDRDHPTLGKIKYHASVQKKPGVPSSHVDRLFSRILKKEGTVYSDEIHTSGSKRFWQEIHSRIPNVEVHHFNPETNSLHRADASYLKDNEHKIWSKKDTSAFDHLLSAKLKDNT